MDAHKPIQDMFFKGHGNYLQYVDSVMAEDVMLKFAKSDYAPVLPIHDSFIMQHAFGQFLRRICGELFMVTSKRTLR